MSFSLSCLPSFALDSDDASFVFSRVPIGQYGWSGTNASTGIPLSDLVDTYSSSSRSGANSQFNWRLTFNFDNDSNVVAGRYVNFMAWKYNSTLDFDVDYVYQFILSFRWRNTQSTSYVGIDFSKWYLTFITDYSILAPLHSLPYSTLKNGSVMFQPSGYIVNGAYVYLTYNVPIYPETLFSSVDPEVDGDRIYIPIQGLGLYNDASGAQYAVTNNGVTRIQYEVFSQTSSSVRVYTPDEWSSHVQQQGFEDLSTTIQQASSDIQGAIEDAADSIINAGDPVDMSGLDNYHDQESALVHSILSTAPYDPDDASAIFNTSNWGTLLKGATFTNNWYNYVFANNSLIGFLLTLGMAFAIVHQALKGLL